MTVRRNPANYDTARGTTNLRQFELVYFGRPMTIAVKRVDRRADGEIAFEVYCHETAAYETIVNSGIASCINLKTGRRIADLGRRYTGNRGK